jgi:hypothetical protein
MERLAELLSRPLCRIAIADLGLGDVFDQRLEVARWPSLAHPRQPYAELAFELVDIVFGPRL